MTKILIINGHPDKDSYCAQLALAYKNGAEKNNAKCTLVNLIDLNFNPVLPYGYKTDTPLEPDLQKIQQKILETNHMVFVYPNWWGTYPALLKGFIDRVFLPRFAFKYHKKSLMWDKLLNDKSARIIVTMDTPKWYYNLIYHKPGHNSLKKCVLQFCGVKPVKITTIGPVKTADEKKRQKWIQNIYKLGLQKK